MGNILQLFVYCCDRKKIRRNLIRSKSLTQDLLEEYRSDDLSVHMEHVANLKELKIKPSTFIRENTELPADVYQMIEFINQGSYGLVVKVKPFYINEERAMKIIKKSDKLNGMKENDIHNEIKILKSLDHPNIIKIHEFFSDLINFYIITEYCQEGDLQTKLTRVNYLSEDVVMNIMVQILSTISYLHAKGILHGDLKLDNILIDSSRYACKEKVENYSCESNNSTFYKKYPNNSDQFFDIKLIDFGCSKIFRKDVKQSTFVGTPYYIAPEVFRNEYDEKSDLWSCGIIMFILLTGRMPFEGSDVEEINKLQSSKVLNDSRGISKNASDLIKRLLKYDPEKRPSAKKSLQHPWFKSFSTEDTYIMDFTYSKSVLNNLRNFHAQQKFQQAVVTYITHNLVKKAEVHNLRNIYKMLDKDNDGRLSKSELKDAFREILGTVLADIDIDNIFRSIDHDNNGYIEYEEFLRATLDRNLLLSESNLRHAFDIFDIDKNGSISVEETKNIIGGGKNIPDNIITDLFAEIDKGTDEEITFEEFKEIMIRLVK